MEKQKENIFKREALIALSLISLTFLLFSFVVATPTGPDSINITSNTTKATTPGQIVNISGGYVSKLNITASVQNPHWKAFAGWINGKFTLDDSSGSTIYDWSLTSVGGEVYATRKSSTVTWGSIGCANAGNIDAEDTALEQSGEDNITATFSGLNSQTFVVAGTPITAASCSAINTYVNNASQSSSFEEVILYDSSNLVFATILEADATGYDGNTYDFQMIVPENGNETWTGATAYYLYVELS